MQLSGGGPDEGFRSTIVSPDIVVNGGDEFIDTFEDSAPDTLLGDFGKPAFHLVEPGASLSA